MLILLFVFGNRMGVLGVMLCYITLPCIVFKASVPLSFSLYSLCILQVDQLKIPTVKDMRHVDRKLKHCWDRSSHDEHKKKEKKSKHKSKRTSTDAQLNG